MSWAAVTSFTAIEFLSLGFHHSHSTPTARFHFFVNFVRPQPPVCLWPKIKFPLGNNFPSIWGKAAQHIPWNALSKWILFLFPSLIHQLCFSTYTWQQNMSILSFHSIWIILWPCVSCQKWDNRNGYMFWSVTIFLESRGFCVIFFAMLVMW